MGPGWTELARMRSRAYCIAVVFVRRRTARFEAWYCGLLMSVPTRPSCDEMLMMEPPPARRMAGMAARVPRNTPLAFTSITWFHSLTVVSSMRLPPPTPALLTRMSSLPKRSIVRDTARSQSPSSVTSSRTKRASPPCALISAATACPSASRMSPMTTRAPSRANSRASLAPMPRAPPLMSATFPASLMVTSLSRCPGRSAVRGAGGPGQIGPAPVPVRRALVGVRNAKHDVLLERFSVDHESDREAFAREAARERHATQVQDVPDRGVAEVAPVVLVVRLPRLVDLREGLRGQGGARHQDRVDVGEPGRQAPPEIRPLAVEREVVGGGELAPADHPVSHDGIQLVEVVVEEPGVVDARLGRDGERPLLLRHRFRDLRQLHALDLRAE